MNIPYALNSLIWSLVGAAGGYFFGRMRADVSALRKKVNMESPTDAPGTPARREHWWSLHRPDVQRITGVVVVLLSLASIISVLYQNVRLNQATACYVRFTHDYSDALRARDAESQQARLDAIDYTKASAELWLGFLANAPKAGQLATPEQRDASIAVLNRYLSSNRAYLASLGAVSRAARNHPILNAQC